MRYRYEFSRHFIKRDGKYTKCNINKYYDLTEYLNENQIVYKIYYETDDEINIRFSVYNDHSKLNEIIDLMEKYHYCDPRIYVEFIKKEIENSNYLWIWPEASVMDYNDESSKLFISECECGIDKKINRDVIWRKTRKTTSKTSILTDYAFTQLIVESRILKLVQDNDLKGIYFEEIKLGKKSKSDSLFYAISNNVINRNDICTGFNIREKELRCSICGEEKIMMETTSYQLNVKSDCFINKEDFYMTDSIFTADSFSVCRPLYIISKRFYKLLKEKGLDGKIKVSPVIEI